MDTEVLESPPPNTEASAFRWPYERIVLRCACGHSRPPVQGETLYGGPALCGQCGCAMTQEENPHPVPKIKTEPA